MWITRWSPLVQHRVQAKRRNQGDPLVGTVESQFQDAVGLVAEHLGALMGAAGCQRRSRLTTWRARGPRGVWRIPRRALTSGVVAKTDRKGQAHRCRVQGGGTTTASTIHRSPGLLTERA